LNALAVITVGTRPNSSGRCEASSTDWWEVLDYEEDAEIHVSSKLVRLLTSGGSKKEMLRSYCVCGQK